MRVRVCVWVFCVCVGGYVCVFASHFLMQKSDFSAQIFSKIKIFMLPTCLMPRAAAATDNAPRAMLRRCRRSWQTHASGSPHPPVHLAPPPWLYVSHPFNN